jgi:hypothetical protein
MEFLCVSQHGESKNTTKNVLEEVHAKNFLPKKMRGKKSCRPCPSKKKKKNSAVSLHEQLKNTI